MILEQSREEQELLGAVVLVCRVSPRNARGRARFGDLTAEHGNTFVPVSS
jgi:hypothetical protein